MGNCEMCGQKSEQLLRAEIEGVELTVCNKCASFGNVVRRPVIKKKKIKTQPKKQREIIQVIRKDYSSIIRQKRDTMGLKQEELAKYLSEKESLIHKIEAGNYVPSLDLARKLEKQLDIDLVIQKEVKPEKLKSTDSKEFTIGDIIKIKGRD